MATRIEDETMEQRCVEAGLTYRGTDEPREEVLDFARAELRRQREQLRPWLRHTQACLAKTKEPWTCSCGLDVTLKGLEAEK
jgi:hypothetical protein